MPKRSRRRPLDLNALAAQIVGEATEEKPYKNPAAVALGRLGGKKGGKTRAQRMTPAERKASAQKAAAARWGKKQPDTK